MLILMDDADGCMWFWFGAFVHSFIHSGTARTVIASVATRISLNNYVCVCVCVDCMVLMTWMNAAYSRRETDERVLENQSEGRRKGAVAKDASGWNVFAGVRRGGGDLALGDLFFGCAGNGTTV